MQENAVKSQYEPYSMNDDFFTFFDKKVFYN